MDMETGCFEIRSELDFVLHFLPMEYFHNTVIPATNTYAVKSKALTWRNLDHVEFLLFLGILLSMEVVDIHGPRHLYWANENGLFPSMNYGKVMSGNRFEGIMRYLQLSNDSDPDQQIIEFLHALNTRFRSALHPRSYLTLDESVIKSYHRNMKGKRKIIKKPRPIGNERKNRLDAISQIVINLELYEDKDIMSGKDYVREYNGATATTLHLTQPYHSCGRCIIAYSWFGSVKSASEVMRLDLYRIMLVKTAHKDFPHQLLGEEPLQHDEWKAYTANKDGVKLQACRFCYLKVKEFISTCGSVIPGLFRKTKHHGKVAQPKAAGEYLKYAASIDIHSNYHNGS